MKSQVQSQNQIISCQRPINMNQTIVMNTWNSKSFAAALKYLKYRVTLILGKFSRQGGECLREIRQDHSLIWCNWIARNCWVSVSTLWSSLLLHFVGLSDLIMPIKQLSSLLVTWTVNMNKALKTNLISPKSIHFWVYYKPILKLWLVFWNQKMTIKMSNMMQMEWRYLRKITLIIRSWTCWQWASLDLLMKGSCGKLAICSLAFSKMLMEHRSIMALRI